MRMISNDMYRVITCAAYKLKDVFLLLPRETNLGKCKYVYIYLWTIIALGSTDEKQDILKQFFYRRLGAFDYQDPFP